jgi:hypothetical protein
MDALRALVPEGSRTWPPEFEGELLDHHLLLRAARGTPERGDLPRLVQIGWWGAVVCWTTLDEIDGGEACRAAAAFNLAIALFDSVLDRGRNRSRELVAALAPHHLERVLVDPTGEEFAPVPLDQSCVTELFHDSLSAYARRWDGDPASVADALELLTAMYRSEIGEADDPFAAKSLPSVFLGMLGTRASGRLEMQEALGRFIASWDDWMDLDEDLTSLRPNLLLGVPRGLGLGPYLTRGVTSVVLGASRASRRRLCRELGAVVETASGLESDCRSRIFGFLDALLR